MFKGNIVALITPMERDRGIDYGAWKTLLDFHLENETDGIVVLGTTGEGSTVNSFEHKELVRCAVDYVNGRIPIISSVGSNSTDATILQARDDAKLDVDGLLIVTPYYNKPTQEGLYRHYMSIAETIEAPQILYNVPSRTACDLLPETVARLAVADNIVAIKETVSVERVAKLRQCCPQDFAILCGDDANNLPMLKAGAQGLISVTANVAPKLLHDMCQYYMQGELEQAQIIHEKLMPLHQHLFCESNPIPVKWACHQMGLVGPTIRLPLTCLSKSHQSTVLGALNDCDISLNLERACA